MQLPLTCVCTFVFVYKCICISIILLLRRSEVFVFHLLLRDLEVGQDFPDVSEEGRRSAEVEVVGGQRFGDNLLDGVFGDAARVNLSIRTRIRDRIKQNVYTGYTLQLASWVVVQAKLLVV